jgi:Leucine-rich repeat (LRR) protein
MGIESMIALVTLYLDDNDLAELPVEIANLKRLRTISLKKNRFSRTALYC